MLQVKISGHDTFSNKMISHLDVLSPNVENRVPRQMDVANVIAVEEDGIFNGDV